MKLQFHHINYVSQDVEELATLIKCWAYALCCP